MSIFSRVPAPADSDDPSTASRRRRRLGRLPAAAVALALAGGGALTAGAPGASAMLPPTATSCLFSFGALTTQGALGTQILQVQLVPVNPAQRCTIDVDISASITDGSGHVPAGIVSDGGTRTVALLFTDGELQAPQVMVGWAAYCTIVAQPVYLHLAGGPYAATYPLGTSRPCSQGPGPNSTVNPPELFSPSPAVAIGRVGSGYRIATAVGRAVQQPGTVSEGSTDSTSPITAMAADPSTGGYWLLGSDGGVFSYSGAHFYGSAFGHSVYPFVAMAATATGHGYWVVDEVGHLYAFGDAVLHGSPAGLALGGPIVGMAATADGGGYWMVAADGGVFNYGDAHFHGSAGALPLVAPIVGMAADYATGGYWLVASDGGVFNYGAPFDGSAGGLPLAAPITGMAATADSGGYYLLGADGGVFCYRDAVYKGNAFFAVRGY